MNLYTYRNWNFKILRNKVDNNIEQISGDSNEDALSTLVDIMVDLDTHYKADDDIHVLKEIGNVPKRLIVFTDGYPCGSWGDADYCDTTWIIHGDTDPNPPFGTFAIYDDHKTRR